MSSTNYLCQSIATRSRKSPRFFDYERPCRTAPAPKPPLSCFTMIGCQRGNAQAVREKRRCSLPPEGPARTGPGPDTAATRRHRRWLSRHDVASRCRELTQLSECSARSRLTLGLLEHPEMLFEQAAACVLRPSRGVESRATFSHANVKYPAQSRSEVTNG